MRLGDDATSIVFMAASNGDGKRRFYSVGGRLWMSLAPDWTKIFKIATISTPYFAQDATYTLDPDTAPIILTADQIGTPAPGTSGNNDETVNPPPGGGSTADPKSGGTGIFESLGALPDIVKYGAAGVAIVAVVLMMQKD